VLAGAYSGGETTSPFETVLARSGGLVSRRSGAQSTLQGRSASCSDILRPLRVRRSGSIISTDENNDDRPSERGKKPSQKETEVNEAC